MCSWKMIEFNVQGHLVPSGTLFYIATESSTINRKIDDVKGQVRNALTTDAIAYISVEKRRQLFAKNTDITSSLSGKASSRSIFP